MADIMQVKLIDLVPSSIRNDAQVQAAASAIERELQAVTEAISATLIMPRIDQLPEDVIDLLPGSFMSIFTNRNKA